MKGVSKETMQLVKGLLLWVAPLCEGKGNMPGCLFHSVLKHFHPQRRKKKKSNFQVQSNSWQTVTLPQKSSQSSHWGLVSCVDLLAVLVQRPSSQRKAGKFHSHLSLRRTREENDNEFDFCFLFTKWRSLPQQYEEAKRTCICHWETCFRIWCNIWL